MATNLEDHFDFSAEELLAIGELFGMDSTTLREQALRDLSEEAFEAALRSARRGLVARGVVRPVDEGIEILSPYDILFQLSSQPSLVVRCEHATLTSRELRLYYAAPELAIEHSLANPPIQRFTPFQPTDLADRVVAFVRLNPGGSPNDACSCRISVAELRRLSELTEEKSPPVADVVSEDAAPFADALKSFVSCSRIDCLHKTDGVLAGGELGWIDAGPDGLWQLEPEVNELPDDSDMSDDAVVLVRRVAAGEIVSEFIGYLPAGEGARPLAGEQW